MLVVEVDGVWYVCIGFRRPRPLPSTGGRMFGGKWRAGANFWRWTDLQGLCAGSFRHFVGGGRTRTPFKGSIVFCFLTGLQRIDATAMKRR